MCAVVKEILLKLLLVAKPVFYTIYCFKIPDSFYKEICSSQNLCCKKIRCSVHSFKSRYLY